VLKLIFFAVLALVGTILSENDGVQIFRPHSLFGGLTLLGTPILVRAPMSVIYQPMFIMLVSFYGFSRVLS